MFVGQLFVDIFGQYEVCGLFVEIEFGQVCVYFEYIIVFVLVQVYGCVGWIVYLCLLDGIMYFVLVFVWVDVEDVY